MHWLWRQLFPATAGFNNLKLQSRTLQHIQQGVLVTIPRGGWAGSSTTCCAHTNTYTQTVHPCSMHNHSYNHAAQPAHQGILCASAHLPEQFPHCPGILPFFTVTQCKLPLQVLPPVNNRALLQYLLLLILLLLLSQVASPMQRP